MTNDQTTLVAVYDDYATAQKAQNALIQSGFTKQDLTIAANEGDRTQATASGSSYGTETNTEGGISGFFHNLFGSHNDADTEETGHYTEAVRRGSAVLTLTVHDSRIDAATEILNQYGPVDFDQRVDTYRQEGYAGVATAKAKIDTADQVIPVVQEELHVGKRAVQRGGVRVYSRVTETPVTDSVTLHEEHARVERRPVNRKATDSDFQMQNEVVEVMETAEEAVVGKTARVVEEVVVGRESSDRTETVRDTVRRTDVEVERIAPELAQDFESDYKTRYASAGDYSSFEPAYGYGYSLQNDARYKGKSWSDVESSAKTDYMREYPNSTWDKVSGAVRYGWEKTTHKR